MIKYAVTYKTAVGETNGTAADQQINTDFLFRALSVVMITVWTEGVGWGNMTEGVRVGVRVYMYTYDCVCDIKAGSQYLKLSLSPIRQG